MLWWWLVVVVVSAWWGACSADGLDSLGRGITKEIAAVKQPVVEAAVDVVSSQCRAVKKIIGLEYEQIEGEHEPDLNQLSIKYVTQLLNMSININAAAKLIPRSQAFNQQKLVIFVHGFTDDPGQASFGNVSDAFISRGLYNILALDGSSLIRWLYLRSTTYVRFMGEKLGTILAQMVKEGLPPSSIHIIGHSLGAHISGFTGKQFAQLTGRRVGRVTGLDPAGPCFSHLSPDLRLNATDADYVDAIHTDGGIAGIKEPVGQADYFPNSGSQQPGCLSASCSHSRAWQYFSESVLDERAFPAVRCDSWDAFRKGNCTQNISYMGIASEPGTTGSYYLQTRDAAPFGLGLEGATYTNNEGVLKNLFGLAAQPATHFTKTLPFGS